MPTFARSQRRSPRKDPQQARSRETVDVLVSAAAKAIERDGYEKLTAPRVARLAGVSVGTFYQYFPNIESLVAQLVDRLVAEEVRIVEEAVGTGLERPLREVVHTLIRTLVHTHRDTAHLRKMLFDQAFDQGKTARWLEAEQRIPMQVATFLAVHPETRDADALPIRAFLVSQLVEGSVDAAVSAGLLGDAFEHELAEAVCAILTRS
jgi:AcrR family transcriptional regulator